MIFSPQTIDFNGFSMVWGSFNHWFQWFSMVMDHWSNDAMVSMDRSPLFYTKTDNKDRSIPLPEQNAKKAIRWDSVILEVQMSRLLEYLVEFGIILSFRFTKG